MDDIDRVLRIAARYGVRVFLHPDFPRGFGEHDHEPEGKNKRGLRTAEVPLPASGGPLAHYCDVTQKAVWFEHLDPEEVHTHLHEVCHCIMQPPGDDIDQLSEDVLLMPFERTLARQALSWRGYKKVIDWQLTTQIEWWDEKLKKYYEALEHVPNYTRWLYWRESFRGLRRMGAIKNGRVTWQRPNWARVPKYLMVRGNLLGV